MRNDTPLLGLKNIGPTISRRLDAAGISTVGDLRRIGPAEAYRRVRLAHPQTTVPVCYYLYSLQGALDDVHWDAVPKPVKQKLLEAVGVQPVWARVAKRAPRKR